MELNEEAVFGNLQDNKQKHEPKLNFGDLVRSADFKNVFNKDDSTDWSDESCTISGKKHNKSLSYRINYRPEKYNENLSKSTKLNHDENNQAVKNWVQFKKNRT